MGRPQMAPCVAAPIDTWHVHAPMAPAGKAFQAPRVARSRTVKVSGTGTRCSTLAPGLRSSQAAAVAMLGGTNRTLASSGREGCHAPAGRHRARCGGLVERWLHACVLPAVAVVVQVTAYTQGPLKVMISGAPAAGKGTQCAKILDKVGGWGAGWCRQVRPRVQQWYGSNPMRVIHAEKGAGEGGGLLTASLRRGGAEGTRYAGCT